MSLSIRYTVFVELTFSCVVAGPKELRHVAPIALIKRISKSRFCISKVLISPPVCQLICCHVENSTAYL